MAVLGETDSSEVVLAVKRLLENHCSSVKEAHLQQAKKVKSKDLTWFAM